MIHLFFSKIKRSFLFSLFGCIFSILCSYGYAQQKLEIGEEIFMLSDIDKITFDEDIVTISLNNGNLYRNDFQTWYFTGEPSGIPSFSFGKDQVIYYPNPVRDVLFVENDKLIKFIVLFDIQGKKLWTSAPENFTCEIDFSVYQPGLYFLKINDQTIKVIKSNE